MAAPAPPTGWAGRLGRVGSSALQRRLNRRALYWNGSPAGPLGQGELSTVRSSPHSSRARQDPAVATTSLQRHGEAMVWMTPTCRSSLPRHWARHCSTLAPTPDLRWKKHRAPRLPSLDAVVISIALGNSRSLCCALHAARRLSATALFWLKIAPLGEAPWSALFAHPSVAKTRDMRISHHRMISRRPT
jgi:hypothetical protein